MSDAEQRVKDLYAEPFFQTLIVSTAPLNAVANRLIVDIAAQAVGQDAPPERRMVMVAPLEATVSLPDWRPSTLERELGIQKQESVLKHPLEEVTGGPDATVEDIKARMHALIELGIEKIQSAGTLLEEQNSLHDARAALAEGLVAWTQAEMHNMRLYSIQFGLDQVKADPDVDRG